MVFKAKMELNLLFNVFLKLFIKELSYNVVNGVAIFMYILKLKINSNVLPIDALYPC